MDNAKKMMMTATVLASLTVSGAALASGGSAAGGSAAGVSHGGTDKLSSYGVSYNGIVPTGQVGLASTAAGVPQTMTYKLSNLNFPDGTVLPVRVIMGKKVVVTASYYSTYGVVYTETDGTVTVYHRSVSLALDAINGDVLPDFPDISAGTTDIRILSPDGATQLLGGVTGHFAP